MTQTDPVFEIQELSVEFITPKGPLRAVDNVSLSIYDGEVLGIVGESGAGKSVTMLAALRLLNAPTARVTAGKALFGNNDLLSIPDFDLRSLRGSEISFVFQDPQTSLNPLIPVGKQIAEAIKTHRGVTANEALEEATMHLERVGIRDAATRARQYPFQWSGGMRQRAMFAMAIANQPKVLIADEPTTALDVTTQAQVLDVIETARRETGAATVLISHDLRLMAEMADRVAVMYGGTVVELAPVGDIFDAPRHPYTRALLRSMPELGRSEPLRPIAGRPPDLFDASQGCIFEPRCEMARHECTVSTPALENTRPGVWVACHFAGYVAPEARTHLTIPNRQPNQEARKNAPILRVEAVTKTFKRRGALGQGQEIKAVDNVSFSVPRGSTFALVGESGSGKSTMARLTMGLMKPDAGSIVVDDVEVRGGRKDDLRDLARRMQIVFQDPYASLDPRKPVAKSIAEPLLIHRVTSSGRQRKMRAKELMDVVGLNPEDADRYPHEFSGGQRQRICIARALTLRPEILVLDEPLSALDVSIQAQIIGLFEELRGELGLTYLFISHDLSVVDYLADYVGVMDDGSIVEMGHKEKIFTSPEHPYTQSLLAALPASHPSQRRVTVPAFEA